MFIIALNKKNRELSTVKIILIEGEVRGKKLSFLALRKGFLMRPSPITKQLLITYIIYCLFVIIKN